MSTALPARPASSSRYRRMVGRHARQLAGVGRHLGPLVERRLGRAAAHQRVLDVGGGPGPQAASEDPQHAGQLLDGGVRQRARVPARVPGRQHRDRERDDSADGGVDPPAERATARGDRGQPDDDERLHAGLRGEHLPAVDEPRDDRREEQHDGHLPGAVADEVHEQVTQRDTDRHADGELRDPPQGPVRGEPEGHPRADGREERVRVAHPVAGDRERDGRGQRRLEDREPGGPHARPALPDPRLHDHARARGRVRHQTLTASGAAPGRGSGVRGRPAGPRTRRRRARSAPGPPRRRRPRCRPRARRRTGSSA